MHNRKIKEYTTAKWRNTQPEDKIHTDRRKSEWQEKTPTKVFGKESRGFTHDLCPEWRSIRYNLWTSGKYIDPEKSVLELACGTGQITYRMTGKGKSWVATDYSENMVKEAKGRNTGNRRCSNLSYCVQDATGLTYEKGTFDVVVIANAYTLCRILMLCWRKYIVFWKKAAFCLRQPLYIKRVIRKFLSGWWRYLDLRPTTSGGGGSLQHMSAGGDFMLQNRIYWKRNRFPNVFWLLKKVMRKEHIQNEIEGLGGKYIRFSRT